MKHFPSELSILFSSSVHFTKQDVKKSESDIEKCQDL